MSIRQQKKKLKRNRCQSCSSTGASRNTEKNGKKNGKRHREEVYTDQHETREVQEKRIEHFNKKGDRHFTDDGRGAEITVDLVLLAKAVFDGIKRTMFMKEALCRTGQHNKGTRQSTKTCISPEDGLDSNS